MAEDRERMIRDRAYSIWEEQGRPHGEDMRHWLQAWQELAEQEPAVEQGIGSPQATTVEVAAKPAEKRTEKTAAQPKGARRKRS